VARVKAEKAKNDVAEARVEIETARTVVAELRAGAYTCELFSSA